MESFKDHLRIINLERTIVFVFHFFLKVEPSGRLILTKNLYWNRFGTKFPLEITLSYRSNHCCVLWRQVANAKP